MRRTDFPIREVVAQLQDAAITALFNPASAHDFDSHQTRVAELLAKKVTVIIQAQYDAGTGLMTRHAFERQATGLLAVNEGTHSILYLDIDRLHVINETFGMHVGDEVIVSVAGCLAKSLPPGALSARISGDRLAALVPNTDLEAATAVAETRLSLGQVNVLNPTAINVLSLTPVGATTATGLIIICRMRSSRLRNSW